MKIKKSFLFILTAAMGLGLALGDPSSVYAMEEEFTLEEITVTAQKREENQQSVPIAMEVIGGTELTELGKRNIDDILGNLSTVTIGQYEDGLRVSIRGMSEDSGHAGLAVLSTPAVAVNKDGIYSNRSTGNANMYDVERVEVLFGPQSTLYSSATPGGIVNIITANPKIDTFEGNASIEYGNYNTIKTQAAINIPVNDKLAFRPSFLTSFHDGYLSNGGMDEDTKSLRLKTLFQPNDKWSIVVTGEIDKIGGQGFASSVETFVNQSDTPDPWTAATDDPGSARNEERKKIYADMKWDIGNFATLSILPSYLKTKNIIKGVTTQGTVEYNEDSIATGKEENTELRLASSGDSQVEWILGANKYYSYSGFDTELDILGSDPDVIDQINFGHVEQDIEAIYGNITYPVTDKLRLSGGARKTWDSIETNRMNRRTGELETAFEMEYSDPDVMIGLEYDLRAESMLYVNYSTAYRVQSANVASANQLPAEKLKAYTAGVKNRFFENRFQLNACVYYYDYLDYWAGHGRLTVIFDENENGIRDWDDVNGDGVRDSGEQWLENELEDDLGTITTGDASAYGIDVQTSTIITPNDHLDFSFSYKKFEFDYLEYIFMPITNWLGFSNISYSGQPKTQSPEYTATLSYKHTFILPNGGVIVPRLDLKAQSQYILNFRDQMFDTEYDDDTEELNFIVESIADERVQEGYFLGDFSVRYSNPNGMWSLNCYLKNITNYAVKRSLFDYTFQVSAPRTYGVVLSVSF